MSEEIKELDGWQEFLEVQAKRQQRLTDIAGEIDELESERASVCDGISGAMDDLIEEAIELSQQLVTDWMSSGWVDSPPEHWKWIALCDNELPDEVRIMLNCDDHTTKTWSDLAYLIRLQQELK